eukprot:SAG11_NODE_1079_length_5962_cov_20.499232_3_plen_161_part_00
MKHEPSSYHHANRLKCVTKPPCKRDKFCTNFSPHVGRERAACGWGMCYKCLFEGLIQPTAPIFISACGCGTFACHAPRAVARPSDTHDPQFQKATFQVTLRLPCIKGIVAPHVRDHLRVSTGTPSAFKLSTHSISICSKANSLVAWSGILKYGRSTGFYS